MHSIIYFVDMHKVIKYSKVGSGFSPKTPN